MPYPSIPHFFALLHLIAPRPLSTPQSYLVRFGHIWLISPRPVVTTVACLRQLCSIRVSVVCVSSMHNGIPPCTNDVLTAHSWGGLCGVVVGRRDRCAFYIAGPACVALGNDVFGRMYDRLVDAIPDADFLAPDFRTPVEAAGFMGRSTF